MYSFCFLKVLACDGEGDVPCKRQSGLLKFSYFGLVVAHWGAFERLIDAVAGRRRRWWWWRAPSRNPGAESEHSAQPNNRRPFVYTGIYRIGIYGHECWIVNFASNPT